MEKEMSYKNYRGTVEYSEVDKCFFGKVMGIRSLISYEGDTIEALKKDFAEAIDAYLFDCKANGVEPEQAIYGESDYFALHISNAETLVAFEEVEEMKKNPSGYKAYTDVEELLEDLVKGEKDN